MIRTLIKPYRKHAATVVLLSLLAAAFESVTVGMLVPLLAGLQNVESFDQMPALLRSLLSLFEGYTPSQQVLLSTASVVVAVVAKNLVLALSLYLGYWLTSRLIADLRTRVIRELLTVGLAYYQDRKVGELVERITYNTTKVEDVVRSSIDLLVNFSILLALFALMLILSWQMTLLTLLLGSGIAYVVARYSRYVARTGNRLAGNRQEFAAALTESLSGIEVIKSFAKEEFQMDRLRRNVEAVRSQRHKLYVGFSTISIMSEGLGAVVIGILLVTFMLTEQVSSQVLAIQLLPFIYILVRLIPTMKELNRARGVMVGNWPYLDRVQSLLTSEDKPHIPDGDREYRGLRRGIRFDGVTFGYQEHRELALRDVTIHVPAGKTTAIVGESGSGKSTIVKLLLRFFDPQSGQILVDDDPLSTLRIRSFRRAIGVVSQDTFIFFDTVRNNIAFGSTEPVTDHDVVEAATKAGAHTFIEGLPDGYDTMLGERGILLSGGQRQRISIARAILKNPEILILDEATATLDSRTEETIHRALAEFSRDRTVIVVAHRLSTIRGAHQIVVMKNGTVLEAGSEEELLDRRGEYFRLAEPQQP